MMKLVWVLMIILVVLIIATTKEDSRMKALRKRYYTLAEKYDFKPVPINGYYGNKGDDLGYNINKGAEIGICIDGTTNDMMHVLLHELAHSNVDKYAHDETFWSNYDKLKNQAIVSGLYTKLDKPKQFCGAKIND